MARTGILLVAIALSSFAFSLADGRFLQPKSQQTSFLCTVAFAGQSPACCTWAPYTALTDTIGSTEWEKPIGMSNFQPSTHPEQLAHDSSIKTLFSVCDNQAGSSSRSATYQSKGGLYGNGQPIRLQFWYKIAEEILNAKLEISTVTKPRGLNRIWSSSTLQSQWALGEVIIQESELYQIRFTARHTCITSIWLSGITAHKMERSNNDDCLPTTTTTTTTTTTPTTTTTTTTTTTEKVYPPPTLTMRVKRYRYDSKCDPWIHANAGRCDPRFDIVYTWIGTDGRTMTHKQYYNAGDDLIEVNFPESVKHAALVQKGSAARVRIVAEDEDDVGSNDHIGTFDFLYIVPNEPEPPRTETRQSNGAEMSVEYTAVFQ
ncbi:uncharacterized protein LOC129586972 [Paramacrobiotus metropolitanus]|uniref:uncharacterized protein LOC129586972 n=1 Tax=Paramacrobiotus metropolitanus TaxID=2943436 RepID=UPI002445C8FC|nr:uncharacterized protein LOC129586972 [Paramacrobiotus metropolitanus]